MEERVIWFWAYEPTASVLNTGQKLSDKEVLRTRNVCKSRVHIIEFFSSNAKYKSVSNNLFIMYPSFNNILSTIFPMVEKRSKIVFLSDFRTWALRGVIFILQYCRDLNWFLVSSLTTKFDSNLFMWTGTGHAPSGFGIEHPESHRVFWQKIL